MHRLFKISNADPTRKIGFIKDLRTIGRAIGNDLGLKQAKSLADHEELSGAPLVAEVPVVVAEMFAAWADTRPNLRVEVVPDTGLTEDDLVYFQNASYAYSEYDWARHDRVSQALQNARGERLTPDLVAG
jgi:hypothetical protein